MAKYMFFSLITVSDKESTMIKNHFEMSDKWGGNIMLKLPFNRVIAIALTPRLTRKLGVLRRNTLELKKLYHPVYYDECIKTITGPFSRYTDEYGESKTTWSIIRMDDDWFQYGRGAEDVWDYLHDAYDTYCQHEYDCCGHFYHSLYQHKSRHLFGNYYFIVVDSSLNV